jgi:hypothetical protein
LQLIGPSQNLRLTMRSCQRYIFFNHLWIKNETALNFVFCFSGNCFVRSQLVDDHHGTGVT